MSKNLIINDCEQEFIDLVYDLHAAFESRVKMGISIHLSGNPKDFKCNVERIESKSFFKLLQSEKESERKKI